MIEILSSIFWKNFFPKTLLAAIPAKNQIRMTPAIAKIFTNAMPPIDSTGIILSRGSANFIIMEIAFPRMVIRRIRGSKKINPPRIVVFKNPIFFFIVFPRFSFFFTSLTFISERGRAFSLRPLSFICPFGKRVSYFD